MASPSFDLIPQLHESMGCQGLENVTDDLFSFSPLTTPKSTPENSPQRKMASLSPLNELECNPEKATSVMTSQEGHKRWKSATEMQKCQKKKTGKKKQKCQKAHQKYKAATQAIHTAATAADSLVAKTA